MMDKAQAIHQFWSSFDIPAYDENTIPTGDSRPSTPYITYSVQSGAVGSVLLLSASVWYKGSSWVGVERKVAEIAKKLDEHGFYRMDIEGGHVWMMQGSPFAQRMSDPDDDTIRRYYLNVTAEFLTAY